MWLFLVFSPFLKECDVYLKQLLIIYDAYYMYHHLNVISLICCITHIMRIINTPFQIYLKKIIIIKNKKKIKIKKERKEKM